MNNTTYGYVRVSTKEQFEDRQLIALLDYGVKKSKIYIDKLSGKDFNRPEYQKLIKKASAGDLIVIKSIDRLGRNYKEILNEWKRINYEKKVDIQVLDMPLLNTAQSRDLVGTLISDLVLQILSFVAENERDMIKRRQAEGIAAAKIRGVHMGRPHLPVPKGFDDIYFLWHDSQITAQEAMQLSKMSKYQFYRMIKKYERFLYDMGL